MKKNAGIKTSEFHIALFSTIGGLVAAAWFHVGGSEIAASLLPSVTYIGGRSYVKKTDRDAE